MKKVTIIGNNNNDKLITDGGRIKIRLYASLLKKSDLLSEIIDLFHWYFHPFKLIRKIKKAVKRGDTILIMAGPKGCRTIIPMVNRYNKKHLSRTVFCPLGIGTLDKVVEKLAPTDVTKFLNKEDYFNLHDEKMGEQLKKLDLIIPQNQILTDVYKDFYKIENVRLLSNFRDVEIEEKEYSSNDELHIMYASRICQNKGIFDLLEVVDSLNREGKTNIYLDVYGDNQLDEKDNELFNSYLGENIKYLGEIHQSEMIGTIKKHDIFCLPTKYHGEGTPGVLIESFIAGTPVLVSSYSQAHLLVEKDVSGFIYEIGNKDELKKSIINLLENKELLKKNGLVAQERSKKYLFSENKGVFIECITGEKL